MKKPHSSNKKSRLELLQEFELAPTSTLFTQQTLCAILDCSAATMERNRWAGIGIPFIKIGRAVRYKKSDILAYLESQQPRFSTAIEAVGGEYDR